jgi:hypothetical protein
MLDAAALLAGIVMASLVAMPSSIWHHKTAGSVYRGFDPNLLSINERGFQTDNPGVIQVSPGGLAITTLPSSRPSVHLVTTSLRKFAASMDVVIVDNPPGTVPLSIGIWSPRSMAGYFLVFGPAPDNSITSEAVVGGIPAQTLVGGTIKETALGNYQPGQAYHLEVTLDKDSGLIDYHLSGANGPPTGDPMFILEGPDRNPNYSDIFGQPVPVQDGQRYSFGAFVKLLVGHSPFKVDVEWLDKRRNHLGFVGNFRPVTDLNGWTETRYTAIAPAGAGWARLLMGGAGSDSLLFADPYLAELANSQNNLIYNHDLRGGVAGWTLISRPQDKPQLADAAPLAIHSTASGSDMRILLDALKVTLTVSAQSGTRSSTSQLQDYSLTLPPDTAGAIPVDDQHAKLLLVILVLIGSTLLALRTISWAAGRITTMLRSQPDSSIGQPRAILSLPRKYIWAGALTLGVFLLGNAALFGLGNSPFDMTDQKMWSYIAVKYGPDQLYVLPTVVSVAKVWGGAPYHEAVFPYEPAMAYWFTFVGWVHRIFLNGPGSFGTDTFQLEFLVKSLNLIFGLGDGTLIYLILRRIRATSRWSIAAAILFIFNPAVWFSMSIFGANHVFSLFLILLAILLIEEHHPVGAWMALGIATLTRPQMLVFAFLVGLILVRRFTIRQNANGFAWVVIVLFLVIAPITLQTSPSLPVDFMKNILLVQEFGGNEPAFTTVSLDAYSIWPLVTLLAAGQHGLNRIFYPSDTALMGSLTYHNVGQIMAIGVLMLAAIAILLRSKATSEAGGYLPGVALGVTGFLMLLTGIGSPHFVLALPFILLCRKWMSGLVYYSVTAVWTVTTLVPMYGILAIDLVTSDYLNFPLFGSHPPLITNLVASLFSSDRFISLGVTANAAVLLAIAIIAMRGGPPRQPVRATVKSATPHPDFA